MIWIFWLSLATLAFTYVGYPLLLVLIHNAMPKPSGEGEASQADGGASDDSMRKVSVVLVARGEEQRIADRIDNLLASDGIENLQIVLVCDGCTDATAERARSAGGDALQVVELFESRGKAHGINIGVAAATGEVVVFADARQRFDEQAMAKLVSVFDDDRVAAVSGSLEIERSEAGAGAGVDLYWRLEKLIRKLESQIDSCIGCTGAIYAIRRKCFEPIPEDTVLDDVVVPMRMAVAGGQVKFLADAVAFDPQKLEPGSESRRKTRTLAGNFQMLARYPGWLLPWRNRLWWQLIAHKYLRLAGPLLLLVCLVSNFLLAIWNPIYLLLLAGQVLLYLAGLLGMLFPDCGWKVLTVPTGFLFLQWLCVRGFFEWLRRSLTGAGGSWK